MSAPDSQEKPKSPELLEAGEKNVSKAERKVSSEAEAGKGDYYETQTKQARSLIKARGEGVRTATHEEFGTPTIEGDKGTLIKGGAPGPATFTDKELQQRLKDGSPLSPAEQTSKIVDYTPVQHSKSSFSLGMDYEDKAPDGRNPIEKLGDFMQAGARRATDPEGWKAWAQGEINKFAGIGAGLNDAKEETKEAVAAGWKALTDGTVVEFLSQPDAINAPVFKTVANAFDAMSKDPNAVNKAFESLGHVVMKASEGYSNLPDYEKGKVIGKVMFGMVNPEGSTEGAEAAIKVADQVATHVDKAVWDTIDKTMKAMKDMAPDLAEQTKKTLYNFIKEKGLTVSELERSGEIPEGYFSKLSGKGGDWPVLNERPSPDVVKQTGKYSCVSACGEMLSNGELKQIDLIKKLEAPCDIRDLGNELGPPWVGHGVKPEDLDKLLNRGPWAAELRELPSEFRYTRVEPAHSVVVDGLDSNGNIMIRDPADGTRYEMTRENFLKHWTLHSVFKR